MEHPGTDLVAVWDEDAERGRAGAMQFGAEFVPDLDALLTRDDIDAVVVTTPTVDHLDVITRAARAGKHVFTEKLLAPSVSEAEAVIRACDESGVKLMVSLPRLYHGYTTTIARVLASGGLGEITYGRVRLSHDGAVRPWLPDRFFDPTTAVGGALTDLGCHPVYLTQLFLGAAPSTIAATYTHVSGRAVEDNAAVTVGYDNGAIGVVEAGFASPNPFLVEIGGTKGWLSYSSRDQHVTVDIANAPAEQVPVAGDSPVAFDQWLEHIGNGTRADDNLARAVDLTRFVVAANHAAETGKTEDYA